MHSRQNPQQTIKTQASARPDRTSLLTELKLLLRKDLVELEQLNAQLDLESEALKARDSEQIKTIASTKSQLVLAIETRAKAKAKILGNPEIGVRPGKVSEGISQLLDPELSELWQESMTRLADCQARNQKNGLVINVALQRTQKIINIVRGQAKAPKLYGEQGKEMAYSGSNSIAKA